MYSQYIGTFVIFGFLARNHKFPLQHTNTIYGIMM